MRTPHLIFFCAFAILVGCTEKSSQHIGGPYYFESKKHPSILSEPGGGTFEFELVHKKDGKTTVISKTPLAEGNAFEWHVYGDNLVFIESTNFLDACSLVLFSEKKGRIIIDKDVQYPPWQIIANDSGIKCQYLDNNLKPTNSPSPKFYSAEFLKAF